MKKSFLFILIVSAAFISCESATYEEISENSPITEKVTYNKHVKKIMEAKCTSCHSSNGSASSLPLTNYTQVKQVVNGIINRIQRPAGDPLRMPQGGSMATSDINTIIKWQQDGLLEN
ncbi:hypothetical protein P3875_01490 [Myroides sp. JBRI-B21084]|uniref:hypothetical protein n=1 Tax=Myroides sp. JBRI-B21084 TaxID=3119977 RepID=UPI0026E1FF52|nr:hypothetical protein [Paenimyroides cloacae]WKW46773.1 hypothetical protein P3875_01490 [Paenimyroides cloacae]